MIRKPVKLLFLDVDGVLNDRETLVAASTKRKGQIVTPDEHMRDMIAPHYVERVNTILRETGARIVLSSTWRMLFQGGWPEIVTFFKSVGFDTSTWLGRTKRGYPGVRFSESPKRGLEIQRFLSAVTPVQDVPAIVILDDDSDMAHLEHRLVRTDGMKSGITDSDVERAIKLFKSEDDAHITFDWNKWAKNR